MVREAPHRHIFGLEVDYATCREQSGGDGSVVLVERPGDTVHARHVWYEGAGGVDCLAEGEGEDEGTEFGGEEGEEGGLELG
jgi:hypothetical protein